MLRKALSIFKDPRACFATCKEILLEARPAVFLVLFQQVLLVEAFQAFGTFEFAVILWWGVICDDVRVEVR